MSAASGLPGAYNFRDLGGLPAGAAATRPGVVMRSDAPVRLGPPGLDALATVGLRTAIDLREPVEGRQDPVDLSPLGLDVVAHPLIDRLVDLRTPAGLHKVYGEILERCGHRLAGAAELLAEPGALPALYFCSAGKDRTGLLTALILSAVGVDDDAVAADYAKTGAVLVGNFRAEVERRAVAVGLTEQALAVKLGAPPELILGVIARLRAEHGGAARYLVDHGLPEEAVERLREALVDRPAESQPPEGGDLTYS